MAVPKIIAGQKVEAIIDCGALGLVVGRAIASHLGVWKRARKINVRQADKSKLRGGHYIINDAIVILGAKSINDSAGTLNTKAVVNEFLLDAELFNIG